MNWPIFSLNFVRAGGGFSRTALNGNKLAATWESPAKGAATLYPFQQSDTRRVSFIGAQIAGRNFRASAAYAVPSRALPAAARTTAENSMGVSACDL
jgi:hypothetical protein